MKRLLAYLFIVLGLGLVVNVNADDIRDFEIERMGIGDSALNYFSEEEIINNKQVNQYPNDKYIIRNIYKHENFKTYEMITIKHLKNDEKYIIEGLSGSIFYKNNIDDCYTKKKIIENEFDLLFNNSKKDSGKINKSYDKTGNSTSNITEYYLKNGAVIQITCDDWSEKLTEENNLWDSLNVNLQGSDFRKWLETEAY